MFVTKEIRCIFYEMAKLNSKKQKNSALTKQKRLVGLTPGDDHLHNTSWGV